jgi:hypothetical protein
MEALMRLSLFAASLALVAALPACSKSSSFPDATRDAAALRAGFISIAPLAVAEKAKVLAPLAEKDAPALVTRLEAMTPPPSLAECHADSLAGARRAAGAMKDLLLVYRQTQNDDAGPRAIASARNIDEGLTQLEAALAACGK